MTQEQIKKYDELNDRLKKIQQFKQFVRRNYPLLHFGIKPPICFKGVESYDIFYLTLSRQEVDNLLTEINNRIEMLQKEIERI